jgi:hypothetical protein
MHNEVGWREEVSESLWSAWENQLWRASEWRASTVNAEQRSWAVAFWIGGWVDFCPIVENDHNGASAMSLMPAFGFAFGSGHLSDVSHGFLGEVCYCRSPL